MIKVFCDYCNSQLPSERLSGKKFSSLDTEFCHDTCETKFGILNEMKRLNPKSDTETIKTTINSITSLVN